jgi:hypothetical protein
MLDANFVGQDKDSILCRYWWVLPAQPVKTVTHEAISTSRVKLKLSRLQATPCVVNLGGTRVSSHPAVRGKHEDGISAQAGKNLSCFHATPPRLAKARG